MSDARTDHARTATGIAILMAAVAACASGSSAQPAAAVLDGIDRNNPFRTGRTLVIAHAGGDGLFPENTLFAYERSTEMGSEVIDIDVRASADGVLVALHDSTVDRTTDGSGAVLDQSYAELAQLDAGWSFEVDGTHPYRGVGIAIPRVEDVMSRFPDMLVTLDLKDQRVEVVAAVCALVERLDRNDSVYVGVDTTEQVMEFRRACPELRTSGTDAERQAVREARDRGDLSFRSPQTVSQPGYLDDDGTPRVTAASIDAAHRRNVAVLTWVIDDPDVMRDLVEACVDGIYTRRPDLLHDVVSATSTSCASDTHTGA